PPSDCPPEPTPGRPLKCLGGNFTLAGPRRARQTTIEAERLPTEHRVHDPADHEGRTDREAAPLVAQTVWIEETLKDTPGGGAEKPNGGAREERTAER